MLRITLLSERAAAFALQLSTGAREFCPVERSNYRPSIAWLQNRLRQVMLKQPANLSCPMSSVYQLLNIHIHITPNTKVMILCLQEQNL